MKIKHGLVPLIGLLLAALVLSGCQKIGASAEPLSPEPTATAEESDSSASNIGLGEHREWERAVPATPATVPDFTILMPRRDGFRLNADGVTDPGNVEAFRAQILEQAMHDPLTLFLYYQASPLGDINPLPNESVIAKDGLVQDGNVYSEEGIRIYEEWAELWTSPATQINAVDEITFQGHNTGVGAGNTPTTSVGVTGEDKSGYDVTYTDAMGDTTKEHSALNRCTQPTTDTPPPSVPPGDTDSKSSNPDDYEYPPGKPPAGPPSGAPDTTPRTVPTTQPGGGGVTDSSGNTPRSESGNQAPGATPAPSTPTTVTPQDGSNSPVPGDPAAPAEGGNPTPITQPGDW